MLLELHITNFALIDELHLIFNKGFSVLTGETGAGKSILLEALGQILGDRADSSIIRTGTDTCRVEAVFEIPSSPHLLSILEDLGYELDTNELLIRREISRNGKNRCWINGQLATLGTLQQVGNELVDLHGQHEHQSLLQPFRQMEILDRYAQLGDLLTTLEKGVRKAKDIQSEIKRLKESDSLKKARKEQLHYQVEELSSANLQMGEETHLVQIRNTLRNAENIIQLTNASLQHLNGSEDGNYPGILTSLNRIINDISELNKIDPIWSNHIDILEQANSGLSQMALDLMQYVKEGDLEPTKIEEVEQRLDLIHRLKRKYNCNTQDDLLDQLEAWKAELNGLDNQEDRLNELNSEFQVVTSELSEKACKLSHHRSKAAKKLSQSIQHELSELGMPHAQFSIEVSPRITESGWITYQGNHYDLSGTGWDDVVFWFSANAGEPVKPLARVISGGELSRLMLALKTVFAESDAIPTLVFDEIDVGIGGATAAVVANKLHHISQQRQLFAITHLPTIAAQADHQYQVSKILTNNRTETQIKLLDYEERVSEIARMIGRGNSDISAMDFARKLLEQSN